jgi:hypothetical protein
MRTIIALLMLGQLKGTPEAYEQAYRNQQFANRQEQSARAADRATPGFEEREAARFDQLFDQAKNARTAKNRAEGAHRLASMIRRDAYEGDSPLSAERLAKAAEVFVDHLDDHKVLAAMLLVAGKPQIPALKKALHSPLAAEALAKAGDSKTACQFLLAHIDKPDAIDALVRIGGDDAKATLLKARDGRNKDKIDAALDRIEGRGH